MNVLLQMAGFLVSNIGMAILVFPVGRSIEKALLIAAGYGGGTPEQWTLFKREFSIRQLIGNTM